MGQFNCPHCGGEYHLPMRSTFTCPNCNIELEDGYIQPERKIATEYLVQVNEPNLDLALESRFHSILDRALEVWRDRQAKYGPTNIAATGALGCYVRANDKLARLSMVYLKGLGTSASDESVADSWLDLLNYAAMGLMCHEGTWPGTERQS